MKALAADTDDIDVRRLRLRPGDMIVLQTDRTLSPETLSRLRVALRAAISLEYPVLVLDAGMELSVAGAGAETPEDFAKELETA